MKFKIIPYNTIECPSYSAFPASGETGKYYLDLALMKIYTWNGTVYTAASFRHADAPTYNGSYLQSGYLEFSRTGSAHPIEWHVGDYIRYTRTGRIYRLYETPQVERLAGTGKYGESFSYRNVRFYDDVRQIENCPFRNLVKGDGEYYYSSRQEVSTADNVEGMAARIQANLDSYYGTGRWRIDVAEDIPASFETDKIKDVTVSGTCLDALNAIYNTWPRLGWTFSADNGTNVITIGLPNVDLEDSGLATNQFSYSEGLTALKRNVKSQESFCTRMHVYGTERNLINRYYNGKDIYNAESVYIPNLMLPIRMWGITSSKPDAAKAYLENVDAIAKYGLIVKDVYFDGSNGRPEVFPSVEDRTIAHLKAAKDSLEKTGAGAPDFYPQASDGTIRLDRIKGAVSMPSDDGAVGEDGARYSQQYRYGIPATIDSETLSGGMTRAVILSTHTFSDSGTLEVSLGGTITITPATAMRGVFARLVIYEGSVPSGDKLLKRADLSANGGEGASVDFSLDRTIRIDDAVPGEICAVLEYGFTKSRNPSTAVLVTATSSGASLLEGVESVIDTTFKVRLQQIGFDIKNQVAEGATLSMKSGMCAGRDFDIVNTEYDEDDDSWIITCNRERDDSTSMAYPNSTFSIAADDEFVLTGIIMPEEYVLMSAERLYTLGARLFDEVLNFLPSYEPTIDSKRVYENIKAHPSDDSYKLLEGKYMRLYDADLFPDGDHEAVSMIASITISENDAAKPTYRVTLSDEVSISGSITRTLGELATQVHTLANRPRTGGGNYYNTIPDGGDTTLPVFFRNGVPQVIDSLSVEGNIESTGGGVSAQGIADLSEGGGGGSGGGGVETVSVNGGTHVGPDGNGNVDLEIDIPTNLADLEQDGTHRTVTDAEKTKWDAAANKDVITYQNLDPSQAENTNKISTAFAVAKNKDDIGINELPEYDSSRDYFRGESVKVTESGVAKGYRFILNTPAGTSITGRTERLTFATLSRPLNIVNIENILI